jgi:prepilin-type N-terminal cleavage/methylation domain-containing protein
MRKAFTMIELIFVIVILGILAAVALPKFLGVAQQAHEANLKNFTGTLNGTLGPSWWSKAMPSDGNVSTLNITLNGTGDQKLATYTDVPKELVSFDLSKCDDPNYYKVIAKFDKDKLGGDVNYYIACKDGTPSSAPKFILIKPKTTDDDSLSLGENNTSDINTTANTIKINGKDEIVVQQ